MVASLRAPLLVAAAALWAAWYVAKSAIAYRQSRRLIVSNQGPGDTLTLKATMNGFRQAVAAVTHEEEVADAEEFFMRAEQQYAASSFAAAAESHADSARSRSTLSAFLNRGDSLLNISDYA